MRPIKIDANPQTMTLYQQGFSDRQIAKRLGCSPMVVSRWRGQHDLPVNITTRSTVDYDRVQSLYQQGLSDTAISRQMGCDCSTIARWRRANGLKANAQPVMPQKQKSATPRKQQSATSKPPKEPRPKPPQEPMSPLAQQIVEARQCGLTYGQYQTILATDPNAELTLERLRMRHSAINPDRLQKKRDEFRWWEPWRPVPIEKVTGRAGPAVEPVPDNAVSPNKE